MIGYRNAYLNANRCCIYALSKLYSNTVKSDKKKKQKKKNKLFPQNIHSVWKWQFYNCKFNVYSLGKNEINKNRTPKCFMFYFFFFSGMFFYFLVLLICYKPIHAVGGIAGLKELTGDTPYFGFGNRWDSPPRVLDAGGN